MPTAAHLWRRAWPLIAATAIGAVTWFVLMGMALDQNQVVTPKSVLLDLTIGVFCIGLAAFRHRAPVVIAAVVVTLGALSVASCGAVALVVISCAARRRPVEIATFAALGVASVVAVETVPAFHPWVVGGPTDDLAGTLALALGVYAVLASIGVAIGARRAEVAGLRRESASLRAEQDAIAEQARLAERTRVAAEVHDELGHRLSVIAVHAAALEYRDDLTAEQRDDAVAAIRSATTQAMTDLRSTLAVLAEDDFSDAPGAWRDRLEQLVADTRQAGSPVQFTLDPTLAGENPPVELTRHLFRITQECLTNALRHAPGEPVKLSISGGEELRIVASNRISRPSTSGSGSGRGLAGITERVRLAGGTIEIRPSAEDFVLEAVLPWRR